MALKGIERSQAAPKHEHVSTAVFLQMGRNVSANRGGVTRNATPQSSDCPTAGRRVVEPHLAFSRCRVEPHGRAGPVADHELLAMPVQRDAVRIADAAVADAAFVQVSIGRQMAALFRLNSATLLSFAQPDVQEPPLYPCRRLLPTRAEFAAMQPSSLRPARQSSHFRPCPSPTTRRSPEAAVACSVWPGTSASGRCPGGPRPAAG